jgi:protein-S-isoprenylcysteine O-methyltransferase Ste14
MNGAPDFVRIIRLHKKWADGYTLLSQLLILLLFAGVYFPAEQSSVGAAERTGAFVLLATIVLATAIWQAVDLGVARVHMLLDGIDLDTRLRRDADPRVRRP